MSKTTETHLTQAEQDVLAKMIKESSLDAVAEKIKISPQTLRAVAGGLSGRRGTLMQVRAGIEQGNASGK